MLNSGVFLKHVKKDIVDSPENLAHLIEIILFYMHKPRLDYRINVKRYSLLFSFNILTEVLW
jgi:hypothetical protein